MDTFLDTLMTPKEEDPYLWNRPMNAPVVYERRRQLEAAKKAIKETKESLPELLENLKDIP